MNILVVNDDGIDAEGNIALVNALGSMDDVNIYVCVPDQQRTAAGHMLTVRGHITADRIEDDKYFYANQVWVCNGTPVDCVKIGQVVLKEQGIDVDLVCSGANHGFNLGTDSIYSGTVNAATEGLMLGIPSVAFSVGNYEGDFHFDLLEKVVPSVIKSYYGKLPKNVGISVNIPDIPREEIKGVKTAPIGIRRWTEVYKTQSVDPLHRIYTVGAIRIEDWDPQQGLDAKYFIEGYITLSPLSMFIESEECLEEIASWEIEY